MDKKLYLIDGHSLIFKMYYAFLRRPMINSKGEDTSILFGFTKYLFELIERERPTHLAVAFDPPGGTFRNRMYPAYKANRAATPQLVIDALEPLTEICRALEIPVLMVPDYEADDVIGTVATRTASEEGFRVFMVTPDKDYGQLVTDRVYQLKPGKGGGESEILGPEQICEKYGIHSPSEVVDILAICGDTADNVPGVKGVGEVGAGRLVGKYGTVPNIYAHIDELPPKQRDAFEAARDHIGLSRDLVTIRRDVPIDYDTSDMALTREYRPEIVGIFSRYEFNSLKKHISRIVPAAPGSRIQPGTVPQGRTGAASETGTGTKTDTVTGAATDTATGAATDTATGAATEVKTDTATTATPLTINPVSPSAALRLALASGRCSLMLETSDDTIFSPVDRIFVAVEFDGECCVSSAGPFPQAIAGTSPETFPENPAPGSPKDAPEISSAASGTRIPPEIIAILSDENIAKVGCDLKRQRNVLHNSGVDLRGRLLDIELMHYLIDPERSHRLEILARSYLGVDLTPPEADAPETLSLFDAPGAEAVARTQAAERARTAHLALKTAAALLLGGKIAAELEQNGLNALYETIEEPLVRVLADMECEGVKVDTATLRQISSGMAETLDKIRQTIRDMAGEPDLNVLSTKQIGYVIFEKLALDPKARKSTTKRNAYPTDEETLTALSDRHPIIGQILEYRGLRKLLSTYIDPLTNFISPRTGRIHTTFNQALTATGRLSSSKPNLQNIPVRTERGREIRRAFVSGHPGGLILSADYSQIELRIMAHLSGDAHMVEAFRSGLDIHSATAAKIFDIPISEVTPEQRRVAKTANFGMIYGISAFGLAQRLGTTRGRAKQIMVDYFANFTAVQAYMNEAVERVRRAGYAETLFGRRRYLPDINARNANVRALAERNAVNAPVQGTAADIIKKAMIGVDRRIRDAGLKSRMVLQVHDELVFDTMPDEADILRGIVVAEMENVITLSVPLTVDCNYGKNWLEAH